MQPFKVTLPDAQGFAKVWNYKGIAVPIDEIHAQFACDYANVVLRSFVEMVQANAKKALEEKAAPEKPLVTLE